MKLKEVIAELDLGGKVELLALEWESSQQTMPAGDLFFLAPEFVEEACRAVYLPTEIAGLAVAVIVGLLVLRDMEIGFWGLIGVVCLLPFAAFPFDIGITPTFLDAAIGAVAGVWALRLATGQYSGCKARLQSYLSTTQRDPPTRAVEKGFHARRLGDHIG